MFKNKFTRGIAMLLTLCMLIGMVPMNAIAVDLQVGDTVTTPDKNPPAPVEGAVWVLTDSVECKKIVHTHEEKCYYKSCDHKDGHISTCYSVSTDYALCEHEDESQHTGSVTLADVVTIDGTNVSWKTEHPAYPVVYAVYKAAYDEAYASTKLSWLKEAAAKAAGVAALVGKTFCYTTSANATPDQCTHGECSDYTGSCYTKICLLEEHQHVEACYQYTWTLKSDLNKNGVADDADEYFVVKYVSDGVVVYEEAVLTGMPTPTVQAPTKAADAQYTYEFVGWDIPVADTVTESVVYTAVYTNIINKYTVTWVDENGEVLEEDKNVEYGKMPMYDGTLPSKQGDNTVVYTFAGWTPDVDKVTGNVTYTATYTSKNVFEVKFFIDNELQKTEYVIDGNLAPAFAPTREHYVLTTWMNGDSAYDFNQAVTGTLELHATWRLTESVVNVKGANAETTGADTYNIGDEVVITATPKEGYAVSVVLVDGTSVPVSYDNGVATVKLLAEKEFHNVEVQTKKVALTLKPAEMNVFGDLSAENVFNTIYSESYPEMKFEDVNVEYLAFSIEIFGKTYEWWTTPGTEVSLEKFLDQYGLGSLASYIPANNQPHAFGTQDAERVRVSYAGNEKYCAISAETTVVMVDMRIPTQVILNEGVKVTYGATVEDILKLVFNSVTAEQAKTVVTENYKDATLVIDNLNAGTHTVVVHFNGNQDYAPSVAEVEIVIEKAQGKVDVESATTKYGTTLNLSDLIHSNATCIEVLVGLKAGANASADMGTVIYINLPELIDMESIQDETVKALIQKVLDKAQDAMSGTMTLQELKEALEAALPYIEAAEEFGYEANITTESMEVLIAALEQLSKVEGMNTMEIKVSIGAKLEVQDAGVYLVAAITSDANYTTAFDMNYAVITPDGYRAQLDWRVKDENGIITLEALRNGYDLSAMVSSVTEGNVKDAEARLYTFFFGVNKNGEMVITSDQTELTIGAYTEFAFIADFGNTMYYAEPIARAFLVAADIVNVQFVDKNGNVNNDRIFEFGEDATMNAVAFDRITGEVETEGTMTYLYMGLQANGELYRGTTAPTRPGTYSVIAVFIGNDEMNVGAAVGALVIKPVDSNFSVEDTTVQYDGNEHTVIIKDETGMTYAYLIVDENNNINLVIPEELEEMFAAGGATLDELLKQLEKLDIGTLVEELPEELIGYYDELVAALKMKLGELKKEYGNYTVTLNGAFPSEIGVYKFYVFAFKDLEHSIEMAEATLTIKCNHAYDHACDEDCNLCGETREVEKHKETYIDRYESTCVKHGYEKIRCKACHEVLSEVELPLSEEHVFHNGKCLLCGLEETCKHNYETVRELVPTCGEAGYVWTKCTKCGNEKNYEVGEPTGKHTFDNACDTTCNGCEHTREVGDHQYVGTETKTPECGAAGEKTYTCTECGHSYTEPVAATGDHTYDNNCDAQCNNCEHTREVGEHVYTNACDDDCNECGAKRTPAEHVYDNDCDADCNVCGEERVPADHKYDNKCDATCNVCGATREVEGHVYNNACDTKCNECDTEREVPGHVYDDEYDADCNECGATRDVPEKPGDNEEPPQTGDTSNLTLWLIMAIVSGLALVLLLTKRRSAMYNGKYSR